MKALVILSVFCLLHCFLCEEFQQRNSTDVYPFNHRFYSHSKEILNYQEIIDEIKEKSIKLVVFIHVSNWQIYWKNVTQEMMYIVDGKRTEFGIDMHHPIGPFIHSPSWT